MTSKDRHAVLATYIRNQVSLSDRPPVGCIQLSNEEASLCADALEQNPRLRAMIQAMAVDFGAVADKYAEKIGDFGTADERYDCPIHGRQDGPDCARC